MHTISWHHKKKRKKLIIIECNVVQVITHKTILFLSANCVVDGRMFGKGASFPDTAETYSWKDFCPVMYNDYHQVESFRLSFQKNSKCCRDQSSSWSTVHNRHKEFQFHRMILKTVTILAVLWQLHPDKIGARWSVWSKKTDPQMIFDIPQSVWSGAMVTWIKRMTKCVHAEWKYLKKKRKKKGLGKKSVNTQLSTSGNWWGHLMYMKSTVVT